jgi:hypothetical protein
MPFKMLSMPLALVVLAATVIWAVYMPPQTPPPVPPRAPVESPQLDVSHPYTHMREFHTLQGPELEWILPYHLGMRREQVRQGLPRDIRWLASLTRPNEGWGALEKGNYSVAKSVVGFLVGRPEASVSACDLFEADGVFHALFFDEAGVLVGCKRKRWRGVLYLSAATGRANHRAEVYAGFTLASAFGRPWPGTT